MSLTFSLFTFLSDVSVLSLEENGRLREPPVGVLSSTARTFVRGGATTEYVTQILGTTVGKTYARLLSTGTRVFQGTDRPKAEPFLVFPSVPGLIAPTRTSQVLYQTAIHIPEPTADTTPSLNEVYQPPEIAHNRVTEETVETVREHSTRLTEIKPVKVRPNSGLPTVTIKADFAPSGFSADTFDSSEKVEEKKSRGGKGLFRGGVQIKNELMKYDTVTYVGFADFTTTVGNTIIIFMPKTAALNNGAVTSIAGEATLRSEKSLAIEVSTSKISSDSEITPTKALPELDVNMQTALPSTKSDIESSKDFNPVYSIEDENIPAITPSEIESVDLDSVTTNHIKPTEVLPTMSKFVTTTSQVYNSDPTPLGIFKSVGVTEEYEGTTTLRTSFLFGTVINDKYTQLTQTATKVIYPQSDATTSVTLPTIPSDDLDVRFGNSDDENDKPIESSSASELIESSGTSESIEEVPITPTLVTQLIPKTVHKTFTFLTTFFIPGDDDSTSTSIRSREVISDEIQYITTIVPEGSAITNRDTIFPTGVTDTFQTDFIDFPFTTEKEMTESTTEKSEDSTIQTQATTNSEPVTTESSEQSTTEKVAETVFETPIENNDINRQTTPILPNTITDSPETSSEPTTENSSESSPEAEIKESEVDVIFKTLYTTYTYFTTFFQETSTSVKSREVIVTNVVTTTADIPSRHSTQANFDISSSIDEESKDISATPTMSRIIPTSSFDLKKSEITIGSEDRTPIIPAEKIQPSQDEYKTYTYYTTVFVDGETIIESRTEVQTVSPTEVDIFFRTDLVDDNSVVPLYEDILNLDDTKGKKRLSYGTISRPRLAEPLTPEALIRPSDADVFKYDKTMARDHRHATTQTYDETSIPESDIIARDAELKKEAMLALGVIPHEDSEAIETMVTDVTSSSSGGIIKRYDDSYLEAIDQISSETNTDEIDPRFAPSIVLQTSYTTFTYFTTVYKGSTSDIISRLETVSNTVTETVRPTDFDTRLSPEEATLPVTYFTTFTYWTTLYKGTNTLITSREETISNIITPTIPSYLATEIPLVTETPVFRPSELTSDIIPTSVQDILEPTTYYTTYTYFTTSYIENETIVNSHLETETNIVTPTLPSPHLESNSATETSESSETTVDTQDVTSPTSTSSLKPTGILSTIRSSEVNDGLTTLFKTDVYGTYIDGLYAQILESSTQVLSPTPSSTASSSQPTGIVSLNEGKIVDADGVSTIFYTTKAIGTYIDDLYAQVIESTSSIRIDEERKTLLPTDNLPTTVIGSKIFRTGLVRVIEGSLIKDRTTTFYESKVIGTLIDGKYAQVIESTTSFKVEMSSTPVASISPTSVSNSGSQIEPTDSVTTPSPTVIESSLSDSDESSKEDRDENSVGRSKSRLSFTSKKNTFTPSIRPFASRPRPTFLPKKKTGDPATTITRTAFTPTVTATPASKSLERGFGSSRNRFAANRKSSSTQTPGSDIKPSSSGGRRFSRPRTTSSGSVPSYRTRSSSSKVQPTASSSFTGSRRGGFNYRTSAARPQITPSNSRFRVRPTIGFGGRFQPTSTTPLEDLTNNDISGTTERSEDSEHHTDPEDDQETPQPTTTESSRRQNNLLLRFRRPPILQRASTTTTTKKPETTTRKSNLLRRPDSRGNGFASGTQKPRLIPTINTKSRQRPGNNLFPPRGLFRKPSVEEVEQEDEKDNENEGAVEEEIKDNEYEGSETSEIQSSTTTEAPRTFRGGRTFNPVQIRPFSRRPQRNKRQAEYGTRSYNSRYRRPATRYQGYDYYDYEEQSKVQPTAEPTKPARYTPRNRATTQPAVQQNRFEQTVQTRIRPSPPSKAPRAQFTLRERSQTTANPPRSSFRRPTTPAPRRRTSNENTLTPVQRSRGTRYRTQTNYQQQQQEQTTFTRNNARTRYTTRRPISRSRYRDNTDFDSYTFSQSTFDGTITVTHKIPTEVTIPIINGKHTEYKNVITAKPSLEVLAPHQYSTTLGKDGRQTILLTSELTSTLSNGALEVTKYIVQETPTTSVTFTPTVLRGRKTSFSHILPSTVYDIREEVSTIQPNLNAPLANLLLSQLLAGNLGLQNQGSQVQPTPTTEYKTKTTTYVTTVTSFISTVLPITFRGKEIKTTVVDSSSQVITATEYLTETVVVTPTPLPQFNNQLNTLLLPALLQAQLLGNQPNPLLNTFKNDHLSIEDFDLQQRLLKESELLGEKRHLLGEHKLARKRAGDIEDAASVVTLYVSGKHPGEFSTVLSTISGDESTVSIRKREVGYNAIPNLNRVETSKIPELGSSFSEEYNFRSYPSINDVVIESSEAETQSLESIVGDVSRHVSHSGSTTPVLTDRIIATVSGNDVSTGHFLLISPAESTPDQRIGTSRSDIKVLVKREIETPLHRRRIKVRIPKIKSDANLESTTENVSIENYDYTTHSNNKKIKVLRKKIPLPKEQSLHDYLSFGKKDEVSDNEEPITPTNKRRKILVSRKRIKDVTGLPHFDRPKITVTRRRPVHFMTVESLNANEDVPIKSNTDPNESNENTNITYHEASSSFDNYEDVFSPSVVNHEMESSSVIRDEEAVNSLTSTPESIVEYSADSDIDNTFFINPTESYDTSTYKTIFFDYDEVTTQVPTTSLDDYEHTTIIFFDLEDPQNMTESPVSIERLSSTNEKSPSISNEQPTLSNESPQASDEQASRSNENRSAANKPSTLSDESVTNGQSPSSDEEPLKPKEDSPEQIITDIEPTPTLLPTPTIFVTRTLTTTRLRTFTYVVTRVSGTEQIVTSTTAVKPRVQTVTVTESLPLISPSGEATIFPHLPV